MREIFTDSEIRALYREAKDKQKQIKILADLNACSIKEIKKIIGLQEECAMDETKATVNWKAVFTELDNGGDIDEIATRHGTTAAAINRFRGRYKSLQEKKESASLEPVKIAENVQILCEYDRIQTITNLILSDDDHRIKSWAKGLIVALARQGAERSMGITDFSESR